MAGALPYPGKRACFFLFARYGDGNMLVAGKLVVCRVEPAPACARNIDFRPGVRGTVLALCHLDIAGDKSRAKSPMPCGLHHEYRKIPARTARTHERVAWQLHAHIVAVCVGK